MPASPSTEEPRGFSCPVCRFRAAPFDYAVREAAAVAYRV
jgi:hypothetical protein